MNGKVEKGDTVAIKDGAGGTKSVTVMSVKPDYERPGHFLRFDYIDPNESSPMRRTAWPTEMVQIIRKNPNPSPDPKQPRGYDNPTSDPQKVIVVDGREYIQKSPTGQQSPASIINPEAGKQVHLAVGSPAKPVQSRGKTDKQVEKENKNK